MVSLMPSKTASVESSSSCFSSTYQVRVPICFMCLSPWVKMNTASTRSFASTSLKCFCLQKRWVGMSADVSGSDFAIDQYLPHFAGS